MSQQPKDKELSDAQAPKARKRPYRRPEVKVLNESEVLATFQITSAFASWWF